ncbi:MAG: HAMP domain-containing histidine kinase [Lachnospiraceae bacterium]|nr:HAMP domain-containing histidine kinase [Lachnospiraceae bacterium]
MKKRLNFAGVLKSIHHYVVFFLLMAFITTCCMMLFIQTMTHTMGITLTEENIAIAAKLTFGNVLLLSFIATVIDIVRRKITVSRPVKKITDAAQQMMQGDFSVRISPVYKMDGEDGFNKIIDCFNKMAEELSGTETLRTDFIANVSHELKTPLAVMQNYATMLQAPELSREKRVEYAKAITDASRRLADLISNILKLNKLENQQILLSITTYDLGEQLCECLLGFEDVWEKKNLEIETEIEDGIYIKTDQDMMTLVWNNLFSNAIKFTENDGKISLRLTTTEDTAIVQVSDTGCGISREVGAHMFDKFYQGDTSHATQGNGLGLALVKRIIDITGSDIFVESEVGKGTTFTVKIRRTGGGEI